MIEFIDEKKRAMLLIVLIAKLEWMTLVLHLLAPLFNVIMEAPCMRLELFIYDPYDEMICAMLRRCCVMSTHTAIFFVQYYVEIC